jgi:hypothetical protein
MDLSGFQGFRTSLMTEFIQRYKNLPQNPPQNPPQENAMMLIKWQLYLLLESRPHRHLTIKEAVA